MCFFMIAVMSFVSCCTGVRTKKLFFQKLQDFGLITSVPSIRAKR